MLIGLISDTHIPWVEPRLPAGLLRAFRGVELVLHAGDIYVPSVLDELADLAPVVAAQGDGDFDAVLADERVRERQELQLEGRTLLLVHERSRFNSFALPDDGVTPDIVVFGHEHQPAVQSYRGVLMVNPGSATFQHYKHGKGTVALLEIVEGRATARIVPL